MKRPGRLEITTKIGCKCNCNYCPQELLVSRYFNRTDVQDPVQVMTLETFRTCIDKLPEGTRIDFSGMAEPWLNQDCTQMVLYAHKKGYPIAIYSTLVGMKQEDFERLKDIPYEEFVVHIPDDKSNTHIDLTDEYIKLFEQVMEYQQSDGRRLVTGVSCHAGIHPAIKDAVSENVKLITEMHNRAGNVADKQIESKRIGSGEIVCINCEAELHHNVLLPDGTILLCCMDYGMKHVLGNLLTQSYDELHKSEEAEKIRRGLKNETEDILCRDCVNARDIGELFDEYELYLHWTKNLLALDAERQKDLVNYKNWVNNLETQIKETEEVYKDWVNNLETQIKEKEKVYKDWVNNLERQNEELHQKNREFENELRQSLEQNKIVEEKHCRLQQELESLSKSPFFKLADKTKK